MSTRQTTAIALPSTSTALSAVASGATYVARTYPKTTSYYVIGLLAALLFTGWTLSPEQLGSYGEIMGRIDTELEYDLAVKTQTAYEGRAKRARGSTDVAEHTAPSFRSRPLQPGRANFPPQS
jgi:hypothetical protein